MRQNLVVRNKIEAPARNLIRPGLSRTFALLERLGNPQNYQHYVHVAGTNGKGSVCAMLESVLRAAGYRTGLYTSPYLVRVTEEIRVNGTDLPDDAYRDLMARVMREADEMTDPPTRFEMTTAAAFTYFYEQKCDIVITEAGMGGAQDATNVIPSPEVCVITNIGRDHMAYLGDTEEEIAVQKAGIIKPGSDVVSYDLPENLRCIIENAAAQEKARVRYTDFGYLCDGAVPEGSDGGSAMRMADPSDRGQVLCYKGQRYPMSMTGAYQKRNGAVVLETVEALRERGWEIPPEALAAGLSSAEWPARFEVLCEDPLLILDGGHNPQCARAFGESLSAFRPGEKWRIALGMLRDKEYETVIDILLPQAALFICLTPENERALPAEDLAEAVRARGGRAVSFGSLEAGMKAGLHGDTERPDPTAVFGSLYLAGPVREWWKNHKNDG